MLGQVVLDEGDTVLVGHFDAVLAVALEEIDDLFLLPGHLDDGVGHVFLGRRSVMRLSLSPHSKMVVPSWVIS